jgi:hypothetical protein
MTIVVTVRVNDGIVLAADSATSFIDSAGNVAKIYNNANKISNLVKVWPIGAMTYGAGSIGSASISTLLKDLRVKLTPHLGSPPDPLALDRNSYTVEDVAKKAMTFLDQHYRAAYPNPFPGFFLGCRICGYSAAGALPEAWEIRIRGANREGPERLYDDDLFGPRWAGETEAIDRLVLGVGSRFHEVLAQQGLDQAGIEQAIRVVTSHLYAPLFLPAMPIQDAIDLAQFLVDASVKFSHFSLRPATVGGPIEIATITKHEGFKWVVRKHYYTAEFNVEK